jgi:hypothetical protein
MRQKIMDKEATKQIKKNIRNKKQEKQARKTFTVLIVAKILT